MEVEVKLAIVLAHLLISASRQESEHLLRQAFESSHALDPTPSHEFPEDPHQR